MMLIAQIENAFALRKLPKRVVDLAAPDTTEYNDARIFEGRTWRDLTCKDLDAHSDAVFGFTPEAFCYFLPGIFIAGISENRPELLVNASLIQMLDRTNVRSSWDEFFLLRWASLTSIECQAAQQWVLWLVDGPPLGLFEGSLDKALQTLQIIERQDVAVPFASR